MQKKKKSKNLDVYDDAYYLESDEYFYYIAGYTSNGVPFGITWEEAIQDGLVESNSIIDKSTLKKYDAIKKVVENNNPADHMPF